MNYNSQLQSNNTDLQQVLETLQHKAAGGADPVLQNKTVNPSLVEQVVSADSGYDGLDKVTVGAIPNTYVKPTATKTATTYTPTTTNQTIAAGTYCSGVQTIKGDANLIPANIVSGKSIFGVAGSATVGGDSSSGGGVETINVNIESANWNGTMWYIDGNQSLQQLSLSSGDSYTITLIKNSLAAFSGYGFYVGGGLSADYTEVYSVDYMSDINGNGLYLYTFKNNCFFPIENIEAGDDLG